MGPDTLEEQWTVMAELGRLAEQSGELEQLVDAHLCRLLKLMARLELEDFTRSEHARATKAAEELGQPGQRWTIATTAAMHALLVGRLTDADRLIDEAFELGREAAPWNARTARVLQRFVLRGLQSRVDEVEEDLRSAAAESPGYLVLQAALASLYAELGRDAEARTAFEALAGDGFPAVPFDEEWLLTMAFLADACAFLDDVERAARLYERLEPFGHRNVAAELEVALGSVGRSLANLAATLGRDRDAARWFERAAETNRRAGAGPWYARTRYDHARSALARREPAGVLLEEAAVTFGTLGMEVWAARCSVVGAPRG